MPPSFRNKKWRRDKEADSPNEAVAEHSSRVCTRGRTRGAEISPLGATGFGVRSYGCRASRRIRLVLRRPPDNSHASPPFPLLVAPFSVATFPFDPGRTAAAAATAVGSVGACGHDNNGLGCWAAAAAAGWMRCLPQGDEGGEKRESGGRDNGRLFSARRSLSPSSFFLGPRDLRVCGSLGESIFRPLMPPSAALAIRCQRAKERRKKMGLATPSPQGFT